VNGKLITWLRPRAELMVIYALCVAAVLYSLLRMAWACVLAPERAWKLSVAFDQLGNAAANGDPDETISSRAAKARIAGRAWGCVLCKLLDALDRDHCVSSIEPDRGDR
jgi:hypothetical protein